MRSETRFGAQLAVAALLMACMAIPATAAVKVDTEFLWSPDESNSTQIYLHVSNMAWEPSRSQVRKVYPRLNHPEWDYPVLVFMAHESGKSLQAVWKMRQEEKSWAAVMSQLRIPRESLVVNMGNRNVPRGKAHGYWKKHAAARQLSDDDIYYWVNIRAHARYFETEPGRVVSLREDGMTFKALATHSYLRTKGKGRGQKVKSVQTAGMDAPAPQASKGRGRPDRKPKDKN